MRWCRHRRCCRGTAVLRHSPLSNQYLQDYRLCCQWKDPSFRGMNGNSRDDIVFLLIFHIVYILCTYIYMHIYIHTYIFIIYKSFLFLTLQHVGFIRKILLHKTEQNPFPANKSSEKLPDQNLFFIFFI